MEYALLFLEGTITFVSPCLLPLLPVYVSYFAAGEAGGRRALINAAGFVGGFSAVFILLGAFAGFVGGALVRYAIIVNIITGAVVVVLGLNFLGVIRVGALNKVIVRDVNTRNLRPISSITFGAAFALGWTPCVGAFLGAALMMAARWGGAATGMLMLLVYSLGLGLPFIITALLLDRLKAAFGFIKRNYKVINAVSGGLLVVVGLLMIAGIWGRLIAELSIG